MKTVVIATLIVGFLVYLLVKEICGDKARTRFYTGTLIFIFFFFSSIVHALSYTQGQKDAVDNKLGSVAKKYKLEQTN